MSRKDVWFGTYLWGGREKGRKGDREGIVSEGRGGRRVVRRCAFSHDGLAVGRQVFEACDGGPAAAEKERRFGPHVDHPVHRAPPPGPSLRRVHVKMGVGT